MPTHDLRCDFCGHTEENVKIPAATIIDGCATEQECPSCLQKQMMVYFGNWNDIAMDDGGRCTNDRYDRQGMIKNFTAQDDPVAMIEMGFHKKHRPADRHMQTFNADQVQAFRTRLVVDGDSPTLRKEILATREANLAGKS